MPNSAVSRHGSRSRDAQLADRAIVREWLSGPSAASVWVAVIFAANIVLTGYAVPEVVFSGISSHVIDAISGPVAVVVFAAARVVKPWRGASRLAGNITIWLFAGELALLVPLSVIANASGTLSAELVQTSLSGVVSYPVLIFSFALIYSGFVDSSLTSRDLARARRALVATRESLDSEIASARGDITSEVKQRLTEAFASLPGADGQSAGATPESLRFVIDEVVRPLSWQLEESLRDGSLQRASAVPLLSVRETRRAIVRRDPSYTYRVALTRLTSPTLFLILYAVFTLPATFFIFGLAGLAAGALTGGLVGLGLWAAQRAAAGRQVKRATAITIRTLIATVLAAVFPVAMALVGQDVMTALAVVLSVFLISFASGLFLGFVARRADSFAEAREVNDEMTQLISRLRQEAWVVRKQLARVVHGQVQSKLLAASLRLARASGSDDASSEREKAQQDVVEAVGLVAALSEVSSRVPRDLVIELHEIEQVWAGVCTVSASITTEAGDPLAHDAVATSCVVEVVRETVSNAVKHGGAKEIAVDVSTSSRNRVIVQISNPGMLGAPTGESTGYGTRILSDVTAAWSVAQEGAAVVLRAEVALARS